MKNDNKSEPRSWATVAQWELQGTLSNKVFLIGNCVVLLAILAAGFIFGMIGNEPDDAKFAATPAGQPLAETITEKLKQNDLQTELKSVPDRSVGERQLQSGKADYLVTVENGQVVVVTKNVEQTNPVREAIATIVRQQRLQRQAEKLGVDYNSVTQNVEVVFAATETSAEAEERSTNTFMSMLFMMLFYMASIIGGMQLMSAVISEKTSRVAEIIASAIPLHELLVGKIVSNTVIALGQMALTLAAGLGAAHLAGVPLALPKLQGPLVWYLAFFLVGFVWLSALWSVAGCLAGRTEDVQHTSLPVTMVVVGMYIAAVTVTEGVANMVFSILPPTSAIMMPARLVRGEAAWWEPILAITLLAITAALCLWVASRVYGRSLLQGGEKLTLAKAWNLEH